MSLRALDDESRRREIVRCQSRGKTLVFSTDIAMNESNGVAGGESIPLRVPWW